MSRYGCLSLAIIICGLNFVEAKTFPTDPQSLSQLVLNQNKFESDDLAWYRFNQKPDWGSQIRVNLGAGGTINISPSTYATFENRYFFVNDLQSKILKNLDVVQLFSGKKDFNFYDIKKLGENRKQFMIEMHGGNWFYTITVRCRAETELTGPFESLNSQFHRFQLHLSQCVINDSTVVVKEAWLTLDNHRFKKVANKSGLQLRSLYITQEFSVGGTKVDPQSLSNLALGMSDRFLLGMFEKLGYRIKKSFLWRHQD